MATIRYDKNDPNPKQMHIQVRRGDIGEYVIVPGDPFRCEIIAAHFENARLVAHNREHKTYTGTYRGVPVSVTSTGMGCPSAAIAAEELCKCGAKVLVRLGGGLLMRPEVMKAGDVAVTLASMKNEGTTSFFVPDSFPAVADPDLASCLIRSAGKILEGTGRRCHAGITATADAFYGESPAFLAELKSLGVMNLEMESAAIFTVCHRYGIKGGCICACGNDDLTAEGSATRKGTTQFQIEIALEAIYELDSLRRSGELLLPFPKNTEEQDVG